MAHNGQLVICFLLFLSFGASDVKININFENMLSGLNLTPAPTPSPAPTPTTTMTPTSAPTPAPTTAMSIQAVTFDTPLGSLPQNQWVEVVNTSLSHGTSCGYNTAAFSFFVRRGTVSGVAHLELQGGGACFDQLTCNPELNTFLADVSPAREYISVGNGSLNHVNPRNPYRDWTHIYVPYCTGDFHFGNKTTAYGNLTVHHKGLLNTYAVRDWLASNLAPVTSTVAMTGCSAGGFGSIFTYPIYRTVFPNARFSSMIDSASTVAPRLSTVNSLWNYIPYVTESLVQPFNLSGVDTVRDYQDAVLSKFSNDFVGTFFHDQDNVQTQYAILATISVDHTLAILEPTAWQTQVRETMNYLLSRHQNFRVYIDAGRDHCITEQNRMYDEVVSGVMFVDWMSSIGTGSSVVNVDGPNFLSNSTPAPTSNVIKTR